MEREEFEKHLETYEIITDIKDDRFTDHLKQAVIDFMCQRGHIVSKDDISLRDRYPAIRIKDSSKKEFPELEKTMLCGFPCEMELLIKIKI